MKHTISLFALALSLTACPDTDGGGSSGACGSAPACGEYVPGDCLPACGTVNPGNYGACPAGNYARTCVTPHGDLGAECRPTEVLGDPCCNSWGCESGACSDSPGVCVVSGSFDGGVMFP